MLNVIMKSRLLYGFNNILERNLLKYNMNFYSKYKNKNIYKYINTIRYCSDKKQYLPSNEWLLNENGIRKIGIDKEGGEMMGEIVYVDFNVNENQNVNKDEELVFIESVKAVESIKAPFDCKVIELNKKLEDDLVLLNENPECINNSWILKLEKLK